MTVQLLIRQQHAQIGVQSEHGQLQLRQRPADMRIKQRPLNLGMHTEHGQIYIDQTQAFADAELKHVFTRIKEYAAKGQQQALKKIAQLAADGERMADIHIRGNAFASLAKRDVGKQADFNIDFIPKYGSVKIRYRPTETTFNVQTHEADVRIRANFPEAQYRKGKVEFYLRQKNSIEFDVVGDHVDRVF